MNRRTLLTTMTAVLVSALALSTNDAFAQKKNSETDRVKAVNDAFYAALSARDVTAMEKVWSTKTEIRHINPRSKAADIGWADTKKGFEGLFAAFPELKVTSEQVHIRVNGATAWVSCIENAQRKNKAGESSAGANFGSSVFEKQAGRWVMVYHHASAVPK